MNGPYGARAAQQRLARFGGLHMTPPQWLHVTVLRAGTADLVTQDDMDRMLARAQADLARTAPVRTPATVKTTSGRHS